MVAIRDKLIAYQANDSEKSVFIQAKQGRFWHWQRVYILTDTESNIYLIQLNIFERIYCNLAELGIENYFKKVFADKKIKSLLPENQLDVLAYNSLNQNDDVILQEIDTQLATEVKKWRGNNSIDLPISIPYGWVKPTNDRKEWWGLFADYIGSTGLTTLLDQIVAEPGIALDVGSGVGLSGRYLLDKGWRVICLDYSQQALDQMKKRSHKYLTGDEFVGKLSFICSAIEEYEPTEKVNLVVASSALPYFDPSKIKETLSKIHRCLNDNGYFIGNFFALQHCHAVEQTREMGGWFLRDQDSVGYLLASHHFELIACHGGGSQNPHSIVFIAKKK